jgi:hypothetical protein
VSGVEDAARSPGPAAEPPLDAASEMDRAPPDAGPPAAPIILRLHDVQAERLVARIVYAHSIEAKDGSVGARLQPLPDMTLNAEMGSRDLKGASEIVVDILYAHDVKLTWIDVRETHATTTHIGP